MIGHVQTGSFPIQVDDREGASPVLELLRQSPDFRVTVTRLKLGDYLLDNPHMQIHFGSGPGSSLSGPVAVRLTMRAMTPSLGL